MLLVVVQVSVILHLLDIMLLQLVQLLPYLFLLVIITPTKELPLPRVSSVLKEHTQLLLV
jgi:hypothetical protein